MTPRPLTLTTPDRALLGQILAARSAAPDEARTLADLIIGLSDSVVVRPSDVPRSVVTLNSRVRIHIVGTDTSLILTLVVPGQSDMRKGQVSVLSPAGSALLGRREGDVVEYEAPTGRVRFRIEDVLYQPEAAGAEGNAGTA